MQNTIRLTAVFILCSLFSFGQELPKVKTEKHLGINGTNIFMVPPDSFKPSANFKGFQDPLDPNSMIMIVEIPGPYPEIAKGFTTETLRTNGMELKTRQEIKVAEFDGMLIELDQSANGMVFSKQVLMYGDEKSTTIINGVYLKNSSQLGKKIRESILTTVIDSKTKSNPREALDYSLNEKVGSLQFHSVMGNGMLFNRDLKTPTESPDKATLLTDKSFAKIDIGDKKQFCISRLKKYPDDYSVIPRKGINEIEIDELKGFELFAKNNNNESEEMYQVILFDNNGGYYLFAGLYLQGSNTAISDIKNVIKTFKRKR